MSHVDVIRTTTISINAQLTNNENVIQTWITINTTGIIRNTGPNDMLSWQKSLPAYYL